MLRRRPRAAAVVSGALFGLSFPPFPFPFLAWFAFVPLLLLFESRDTGRTVFLDAYIALLVTFAVAFQWPLFHVFPTTALLSLPPLLIIPMWMALPFGLAQPIYRRAGPLAGLFSWMAFFLVMELGLRIGPLAFPWTLAGHSQAELFPVNQLAAFGGVPLLTLFVVAANAGFSLALRRAKRTPLVFVMAAALLPQFNGADVRPQVERTRVAGIQPAYSPAAWASLNDSSRVAFLLEQSRAVASNDSLVDLILWPETAIPPRPQPENYLRDTQTLVDSLRVPILAGAITSAGNAYRNSAILFAPGAPPLVYDKINLVPFAERVPFTGTFSFLERLAIPAGGVSGYEPGETRALLDIPGFRFGVLICFETLFADATRAYVQRNTEALIAITQDGWWRDSFGYRQHLAFNRLRAIETGVPLIHAAVSGVSALIRPDGRIEVAAGWMEKAVWTVDVPPPSAPPPYVRFGDWVTAVAAIAALLTGLWTIRSVIRNRM